VELIIMLWAILSDIHGRVDRLARVLADAAEAGVTCFLSLGDVGGVGPLDMLADIGARCVFGNWEASGLRGMAQPYRGWVARWHAHYREDGLWAGHASPVWPAGLEITQVVDFLRRHDLRWMDLFPSLCHSETARWEAFAELEATQASVFFHGHTHVQEAWHWQSDGALTRIAGPAFTLADMGDRYLVGVGSVGMPHDGRGACYVLYEDEARVVEWRRV